MKIVERKDINKICKALHRGDDVCRKIKVVVSKMIVNDWIVLNVQDLFSSIHRKNIRSSDVKNFASDVTFRQ